MSNSDEIWEKIKRWGQHRHRITLPRGSSFDVQFDPKRDEVEVTPLQTGIPRRIGRKEFDKLVKRFNEVTAAGYEPFRPGHYARESHNSSYFVAILKEIGHANP